MPVGRLILPANVAPRGLYYGAQETETFYNKFKTYLAKLCKSVRHTYSVRTGIEKHLIQHYSNFNQNPTDQVLPVCAVR